MKILFQGDSITDASRCREDYHHLGYGYPKYAAAKLKAKMPSTDFEFVNLGISGHKVEDLKNRWQSDCVDIAPNLMSILIGVNDTWHHADDKSWIPSDVFEADYRYILEEAKKIDGVKLIMMEPFLLPAEDKEFFREDLDPKIQIIRKLAREYADAFIPLDGILTALSVVTDDKASMSMGGDGVHPSETTADFIGGLWADAAYKLLK